MNDVPRSAPTGPGRGGAPGHGSAPEQDPEATQRIVVGRDSRIREVGGTRDARRDPALDLAHDRGDTVERRALFADEAVRADRGHQEQQDPDELDGGDEEELDPGAHPVAVPLAGFFTGMVYVLVMPVLWFWLSDPTIGDLLSADLVFFLPVVVVPVALALVPRTRRFGRYMLLGSLLTGVVVVGVAAIVLSFLIFTGS